MPRITVLIAEDHTFVREGFRRLLEMERDFEVVGEAKEGRQAVSMASRLLPSVVLMDIGMPLMNGLEATRQLGKSHPEISVLILSGHQEDAYIKSALESGAKGFLLKQTSAQDACQAIREVYQGGRFFSASIGNRLARLLANGTTKLGEFAKKVVPLSSREMEILQLIAEGRSNKEVAEDLGITLKTVGNHREHLMKKLDIHDTAGLTRYAIGAGIIEGGSLFCNP